MRTISSTALAQVTANLGGEPLVVVAIYWDGVNPSYYCDRGAFQDLPQLQGKILKMANLEDVVNISNSTSSQSVSITLDDIDQTIKAIYNVTDIHKKLVIIYQWFTQINFNEKFVIFEGVINSPIVWSEKDRTLSFDIVSRLEDAEIGYSPEEGDFPNVADNLLGKPWPLPFGTVYKIPGILIDIVSNAVLMDSIGLHDPKLDADIFNLLSKSSFIQKIAFTLIFEGGFLQFQGDWLSGTDVPSAFGNPDDPSVQQGVQMVNAGNKLLAESFKMLQDAAKIQAQLEQQKAFEKKSLTLYNGVTFPLNHTATMEIGGLLITGSISASTGDSRGDSVLNIESITAKVPVQAHLTGGDHAIYQETGISVQINPVQHIIDKGPGFVFEKAGTHLKWTSDLPQRWIVAMLHCQVLGVFAIRDYGGSKIMTAIPTNYYSVSYEVFQSADGGPGVEATIITLNQPMTYLNNINSGVSNGGGGGWEDQIYVDLISPVGPNTVGILEWMIATYTGFGWDSATFADVAVALDPFPMNFCLFERKNILQALQEIAFQARCAIFLKENLFYLIYLVPEPTPVDTITLDDIIYGTLELHHTPTEQIVTKFVASYKIYYGPQAGMEASDIGQKDDKIILRNNFAKYGLHQQQYNYYAFTSPYLVDLSATFWLIRKSNTWKQVTFKTPLHKMKLETFDAVTINFSDNWVCTGSIVGIVESAVLDTDAMEISFSIWIPVRLGEMTRYQFANPVDSEFFFFPEITIQAGSNGPGETTGGILTSSTATNGVTVSFPKGNRRRIHHGNPNPGTRDVILYPVVGQSIGALDTTEAPTFEQINQSYDLSTDVDAALMVNKSIPAKIVAVSAGGLPRYRVLAYLKGTANSGVTTGAIDATYDATTNPEPLEAGTWVMISQLVYTETDDQVPPKKYQKRIKVFIPSVSGSSTFPGEVIDGDDDTYTVNIYKHGLDADPEVVTVTQLQINNDTIPAGTWALVTQNKKSVTPGEDPNEYTMQVPVFLE